MRNLYIGNKKTYYLPFNTNNKFINKLVSNIQTFSIYGLVTLEDIFNQNLKIFSENYHLLKIILAKHL